MYEFMKEYGYNNHTGIYACCNKRFRSYDGKHFLYYSEYKNMTEKDLKEYFDWCYEGDYLNHFYSTEDIVKFKKQWESHIIS